MDYKTGLQQLMKVEGALGVALVDYGTGMLLGSLGGGVDLEIAASGNTEVVRAKVKTLHMLGLRDGIDDIVISLGLQYHLIRPLTNSRDLFLYYVLDRATASLAFAKRELLSVSNQLDL